MNTPYGTPGALACSPACECIKLPLRALVASGRIAGGLLFLIAVSAHLNPAQAQTGRAVADSSTVAPSTRVDTSAASTADLSALSGQALAVNPRIVAAQRRVDAARARVSPAGLLPDPMLMVGIQNYPLGRTPSTGAHGEPSSARGPDPMTMRMVGIEQSIPYPGKLSLRRTAADREVDVTRASLDGAARDVVRDVKTAYYELAFVDQALTIVGRNRDVLAGFIRVTEARYAVGTAGQQDILKARVEATRLAETAATLTEQRRGALARLNALLARPSESPIEHPTVPAPVTRAAVTSSGEIRFASAALGSRVADSPFPPLAELQDAAVRNSPEIHEQDAMIAAQSARLALARKDALPDFDVSVQYGQRGGGLPDMMSASVSVPLPIFKRRKQDQAVSEADAQLAALGADRDAKVNDVRAEVASLVAELERSRSQLALYVKALLPEARASLTSAAGSYEVGRVEFLNVLDSQATVFTYETEYFRALSDFATKLAELERVTGEEIVR
jgi:outer membrane protein TolC